jgi:hypothetical protein
MSKKAAAKLPARRKAVAIAFERDGGVCTVARIVPEITCWGPLDGHEPLTRARGGDACDPGEIITVCRGHHQWIDDHQEEAKALGLLRSQGVLYLNGRLASRLVFQDHSDPFEPVGPPSTDAPGRSAAGGRATEQASSPGVPAK